MTRNRLSLVLTVVVVAAMWIALSPPLARAATPFFGLSPATSTSEQEIQRLAGGGARVMRFSINWNAVQAKPNGPYNWNPVDGFVLLATRYGVTPLPKLIGSPSFAASDFFRPPLDTGSAQKQWQEFVRAAVTRYGTTGPGSFWDEISNCSVVGGFCDRGFPVRPIRTWQIWNEPNKKMFFKPLPNAGEYAQLLRLSYTAIHDVDPDARILAGGMAPDGGRYGPSGAEYLADLYRSAPDKPFDGVSVHPYAEYSAGVIAKVEETRAVMNANGDANAPLWVTEFGWGTDGPKELKLVATEAEQEDRVEQVMETLSRRRGQYGLGAVMAYTDQDFVFDPSSPACQFCPHAGLIARDGRAKPAWYAFSRIALGDSGDPPRLVSTQSSTARAMWIGKGGGKGRKKGRRRSTSTEVTTTVERYSDGYAIVEMNSDDLSLNKGLWKVTSCLRFLAGSQPGSNDALSCERTSLRVKSRKKRKAVPPGDQLSPLSGPELAQAPYATRPRVLGYVTAEKRRKGKWRTRVTSLAQGGGGLPLR